MGRYRVRNVTLAMDEQLIERGHEYARRRGMSFNALIREQLQRALLRATAADGNGVISTQVVQEFS